MPTRPNRPKDGDWEGYGSDVSASVGLSIRSILAVFASDRTRATNRPSERASSWSGDIHRYATRSFIAVQSVSVAQRERSRRWVWIDMTIPNPAMRVTMEVPP